MIAVIGLVGLIVFIGLGMPVAFAMIAAGVLGLYLTLGPDAVLGILTTAPYRTVGHFTLTAIPLFVLMAEFIVRAGISRELYAAANKWIGHFRGGLGVATIIANAGFAAMCGSSAAAVAAFSGIAIPEMRKYNYPPDLASGAVAVAGTLAILIPPSIPLVIYGIQTGTSIGKLLIAGILPGILSTVIYSIGAVILARLTPDIKVSQRFSWKARLASLKSLWASLVLIVLVLGVIYAGIATPTEAAAIGACGGLIIGWARGRLSIEATLSALMSTLKITTMIFVIVIGATIFGNFLTVTGAAQTAVTAVATLPVSKWAILVLIVLVYLIAGCFLDVLALLLLTLPVVFPVIINLGFDPIWWGIISIVWMEFGVVTPPVGMNVYVTSGVSKIPLETVFKGVAKFLVFELITLFLLILFPQITLILPSRMG